MKEQEIINKARIGFDKDFSKKNYMEKRTEDNEQLNKILNSLNISHKSKILNCYEIDIKMEKPILLNKY